MISKMFLQAVKLCLSASIVTGLVLLLRFAFKKAPKSLVCALWILVGLRLVIPTMPSSSVSVIPEAVSGGTAVEALEKQYVEAGLSGTGDKLCGGRSAGFSVRCSRCSAVCPGLSAGGSDCSGGSCLRSAEDFRGQRRSGSFRRLDRRRRRHAPVHDRELPAPVSAPAYGGDP